MLTPSITPNQSSDLIERRSHNRFQLRPGAFAGCSPNVGEILNISLGGIAFNYVEFGGDDTTQTSFILCGEDGCCLEDIPYTVISDKVCQKSSSLSHIVTRQRRLQFDDLSEDQTIMLQNFITNNAQDD